MYLGLANETGYPHQGYLDFAAISVTPTTGTLQLRGIFPNGDYKILPGLFARIKAPMLGSAKESWLVPEVALGFDQLGALRPGGGRQELVERRQVKEGARVGDHRVIDTGLNGDEEVISQRADSCHSRQAGDPGPEGAPRLRPPAAPRLEGKPGASRK